MTFKTLTPFFLTITLLAGCRADVSTQCDDEQDSQSTPTPLNQEDFVDGATQVSGLLCTGDSDWYSINAFAGQMVEADLSFPQADGDLQMELMTIDGSTLDESVSITSVESVRHVLAENQDLLIRVYGDDINLSQNSFDLDVRVTGSECSRDAYEPNDSGGEPWLLEAGTYENMSVCFGEDDWYEIPVQDGQVLTADFGFAGDNALIATLYSEDASGQLAWLAESQSTTSGAQLSTRVSGTGPFLMHATRGAETSNVVYSLDVDITGDACAPDFMEPNDGYFDATVVSGDTVFEGGTICLGDNDWFQVELENGQVLSADLLFSEADGDLAIRVYQLLDDGTISYRAQSSTWGDNETINYRPPTTGTYLLWVWPTHGSQTGAYDLDVAILGDACVDDSFEPNNHWNDAADLVPGTYGSTTLCVADDDYYSFTATNGQMITASIGFNHADNDLGLNIYKLNDDGTLTYRAGSNTVTDDETINYRPFEDGTFIARVYRSRGTVLATYTMDFSLAGDACVADAQEPNDAYSEAAGLASGNYPTQTLCVGDSDWYQIDGENGQLMDISVTFTHADNDLGVALYKLNADGTISYRSGSNSLTDNETIAYRPYETGEFLVYVYRTRGTQLAEYEIDVGISGAGCSADTEEPNNNPDDSPTILPGSYPAQTLCVGDTDWYAIDADAGQLISADIGFNHADNDLGLNIYKLNSDGTWTYRSGSNTLTDNEEVNYRPYDGGTFLIYVYRSRGAVTASYSMNVDVTGTACVPDSFEQNDHWTQGATLPDGTYPGLSLCVGDADWYEFSADNGEQVSARISFQHSDNDLGMRIYQRNSDGTITSRSGTDTLTDNEWLLYTPYQSGDYLLYVYRSRGTTTAAYDLDFSKSGTACVSDGDEPNDHWLQTADYSANVNSGTPTSHTSCVGDDDYYSIGVLNTGEVVNGQLTFTQSDNDFALRLYLLNGDGTVTQATSADTISDNEYLVYTVPDYYAGHEFLVRVHRSRGTVQGAYDLQVDKN